MPEPLIFLFFLILFFFIPGWSILERIDVKIPLSARFTLSLIIGICIFIYLVFLIRVLQLPFEVLYIYIIYDGYCFYKYKSDIKYGINLKELLTNIFPLVIFAVIAFTMVVASFRSGFSNSVFRQVLGRDTLWRLSIITELTRDFPPMNPAYPSETLKNYHFFYDLAVAGVNKLTKIDIINLYNHYFSIVSAFLFVVSIYAILRLFLLNKLHSVLGTIFSVYAGNVSYILPMISSQYKFITRSNIFMSDQPFDQSYNHFNLLAYALMLSLVMLFSIWNKGKNFKLFILISVVSAVLCGVKIYAGILALLALGLCLFIETVKKRFNIYYLLPIVTVLPVLRLIGGRGFSILTFNPGWVLTKMIEDNDRLNLKDMVLKEQYYQNTGNTLRIIQLKLEQILIYVIGNFNLRLIGIAVFIKKIDRKYFSYQVVLYMGTIMVAAFMLPLLFSQNRAPYDSIQFTPYALLIMSILAAIVINDFFTRTKLRRYALYRLIIYSVIIIAVIPSNIAILSGNLSNGLYEVDADEIKALDYLKKNSPSTSLVMTDMSEDKMYHMYVNVLSQRKVFLSGKTLAQQTGIDTKMRENQIRNFFIYDELMTPEELHNKLIFLNQNNINYVYLSKEGLKHQILLQKLNSDLVYKGNTVQVYKIN